MTHYIQCTNSETTRLDDEWLILHTKNFTITKLNAVGGFCWSLLSEVQSIDTIIEAVQAHFEGAEHMTKMEIEDYLAELNKYGLIQNVV